MTISTDNQLVVDIPDSTASTESPAIWYRDPTTSARLFAIDWNGRQTGSLSVYATGPFGVDPSPHGDRLLLRHASVSSGGTPGATVGRGTWAGDSLHLWSFLRSDGSPSLPQWREVEVREAGRRRFVSHAEPAALFLQDAIAGDIRKVADFGEQSHRSRPDALRCSVPHAVAFAAASSMHMPFSAVRRIDLVTGEISELGFEPAPSWGDAVFSNDGTLVGVGCSHRVWREEWNGEDPAPQFSVYEVATGTLLARFQGVGIAGFSDDNSRILTIRRLGRSSSPVVWSLLNWQAGLSLWSMETSPGTMRTRPGTGDFVVADRSWRTIPAENRRQPVEDLWIVRSDGQARLAVAGTHPLM
ncbi:MAG TPA: hypothetical protein VMV09_02900 [Candidatus Saccharimonadales bacterium]|nr:hypothetical protein [Candidatus Saccharimonadales bacterium]